MSSREDVSQLRRALDGTACLDREPPATSHTGFELSIAGDAEDLVPALIGTPR